MSLKDFLKTDYVDLNKSPMFKQLIQNLKKEKNLERTLKLMSFTFKNSVNQPVTADLKTDRYINDNLAIMVFETEPEEYDDGYYCDLTTNFAEALESPDMFYLDTNNAPANLIAILEKDGIFTYTGRIRPSGFCNYPVCQLTEKGKALLKL